MYLGVDGGGTKTAFLLLDASGRVLATHQEGSAYYIQTGLEAVGQALASGVRATLEKAQCRIGDVRFAFFGLPAHGEDRTHTLALDALPASFLPRDRYVCANDAVCGWAGSLAGADGISVVAGTGSISYGEYAGRSARCGGWGELFSDEGSAYWIARAGLKVFSRMSDGRETKGPLYTILRERLSLVDDLDITGWVYTKCGGERDQIAAISEWVHEAALASDPQAQAIFARAGHELALMVNATRGSLAIPEGTQVPVSYSGGVFKSGALVLDPLVKSLAALSLDHELRAPRFSPVIGAALYAARAGGEPLSVEALRQLETQSRQEPALVRGA